MKQCRRAIAYIMAFALLITMLPVTAYAKTTESAAPYTESELETIEKINEILKKTPVTLASKGECLINSTAYNEDFYWDAVASDDRVPFDGPYSYARYLIDAYNNPDSIKNNKYLEIPSDKNLTSEEAVKTVWYTYLYDICDPDNSLSGKGKDTVKENSSNDYGDSNLSYFKSSASSFHQLSVLSGETQDNTMIKPLNYSYLENGADYSSFIDGIQKTSKLLDSAKREYEVDLSAKAQAKVKGAVAMVLNIQTSWQMFDLAHANAKKGVGGAKVGPVAENSNIIPLYNIKRAILRFTDYMAEKYPGNNLALGFCEFQHNGSSSMFETSTGKGGPTYYVTNDTEKIREGLLGWDVFGNCEHNHYDTKTLKTIAGALSSNLETWKDNTGNTIGKNNMSATLINIGGATEDSEGNDGYALALPWDDFTDYSSVYGIRTNAGESLSKSGLVSWIDYSKNNGSTPFANGTGDAFTKKYTALTEDELYNKLIEIAEEEMRKHSMSVPNADELYVEDVTLKDTVAREFDLNDGTIMVTIKDKNGSTVKTRTVSTDDSNLKVTDNENGTTEISYNFGKLYSGQTAELSFHITAKDDFIGSNNVKTNVGTPSGNYTHNGTAYDITSTATPEVNVPIRFTSGEGGTTTTSIGEKVHLKDLSNDIVADAESRIEKYPQINGTLKYEWVLPDGTKVPAGSVTVKNGSIGDQSMPDHDYVFTPDKAGETTFTLNVTFTPNDVMDNGNFADESTKKAVEEKTESKPVKVNVADAVATETFRVRKIWDNTPDNFEKFNCTYDLMANGEKVGSYTLTEKDIVKVNGKTVGWTHEFTDLDSYKKVDGKWIKLEYTVKETNAQEHDTVDTYEESADLEEWFKISSIITFTPKNDIKGSSRAVRIYYTYNGEEKYYDTTVSQISGSDILSKQKTYSVQVDEFDTIDRNDKPEVKVTKIEVLKDGEKFENKTGSFMDTTKLYQKFSIQITNKSDVDLKKDKNLKITYVTSNGESKTITQKINEVIKKDSSAEIILSLEQEVVNENVYTPKITEVVYQEDANKTDKDKDITSYVGKTAWYGEATISYKLPKKTSGEFTATISYTVDGKAYTYSVPKDTEARDKEAIVTIPYSLKEDGSASEVKVISATWFDTKDITVIETKDAMVKVTSNGKKNVPVLEIHNTPCFYVYHSSTGQTETIPFDKEHLVTDEDGNQTYEYDLTKTTFDHEKFLYAGQYSDENLETPLGVNGMPGEFDSVDENGNVVESATGIHPAVGQKYYLKELSVDYLRPRTIYTWWYPDKNKPDENNTIAEAGMVTCVDNENYAEVGFMYQDVIGDDQKMENSKATTESLTKKIELEVPYSDKTSDATSELMYDGLEGVLAICKFPFALAGSPENERNEDAVKKGSFTGTPYFITFDGVQVTGDTIRDVEYTEEKESTSVGEDHKGSYFDTTDHKEPENISFTRSGLLDDIEHGDFESRALVLLNSIRMKTYHPVSKYTITVVDGDQKTEISTAGGDVRKELNTEKDGALFAGFYTDKDFTKSADLTSVSSDMTVYVKYVNTNYLRVAYQQTKVKKVLTKLRFVSAVEGSDYDEYGFVLSVNGKESVQKSKKLYSTLTGTNAAKLFENMSKDAKLFYYDFSTKNFEDGTVISITPYWITKDGTNVKGTTRKLTYHADGVTK